MSFGPEWFVVLGVIVLLFGAKKLPELARSLGKSSNEFKRGLKDGATSDEDVRPETTTRTTETTTRTTKADGASPTE